MTVEFDSERQPEDLVRRTRGGSATDAPALGARVLALQRQAGNAAVVRALGLQRRTLARDQPWTFNPLKPTQPDLRPWESKDPAVRARWEEDMRWLQNRPNSVKITVTASGLKDALQKPATPAEAQAQNPPAPVQPPATQPAQAQPAADQPAPAPAATAATSGPTVKGVQIQVQYGMAGEVHTKQSGPGADPKASQTDWQSSAQVALTVVYHDGDTGVEWSNQFQVAWSDTDVLRAMSPTALQSVQIGSQLAYVMPLWKNAQLQIFGQVMFGVTPEGRPTAQVQGGAQIQMKIGKGFSLFIQGAGGGTKGSGPQNAPNYTGDASLQGGIMYSWP